MADFLLEIGLEEIPARMIGMASNDLYTRVTDALFRNFLIEAKTGESLSDGIPVGEGVSGNAFSTPRRLALLVHKVTGRQPDTQEQVIGPSTKVAYKDGVPTPAAEAFAKKVGVSVDKLTTLSNAKGEYLAATVQKKGRAAADVLAELLPKEIASIYWAKNMYWRAGKSERFVRPVRWIVAKLDDKVIPLEFAGIKAGAESEGHRILHKGEVKIGSPADYAQAMEKASVIVSPADRKKRIEKALDAATRTIPGARWRADDALVNTVVNLTEYPSVVLGSFDKQFLSLPEEVLVTVMRDHQKYFAVEDAAGKLAPYFLAVLNTDGDPEGLIRHGNERVLRARFADAQFFWETDQKTPLKQRVEMLRNVTFQKDLGSYYDKVARMARLVDIGGADFDHPKHKIDRNALHEAAWLAKADLTTELVKEFTELQGVVGGLYARAQKLPAAVADAIYDQYKPTSMEDAVPRTPEAAMVALADKADSIAGMFALGMQPTGSKDPFALRRAANGIVKTIVEHGLPLDLRLLFREALAGYKGSAAEKKFVKLNEYENSVAAFFRERLEFYLKDVRGFAYDEVNAVLAAGSDRVTDVVTRAEAVAKVRKSPDFEPISVAFKRIKNILRQAKEARKLPAAEFKVSFAVDPAEKVLGDAVGQTAPRVAELRKKHDYAAALAEIAKLRPALDTFFDKVMVMVDDEKVRANRLALLSQMLSDFSTIADFSEIVTQAG